MICRTIKNMTVHLDTYNDKVCQMESILNTGVTKKFSPSFLLNVNINPSSTLAMCDQWGSKPLGIMSRFEKTFQQHLGNYDERLQIIHLPHCAWASQSMDWTDITDLQGQSWSEHPLLDRSWRRSLLSCKVYHLPPLKNEHQHKNVQQPYWLVIPQ